MARVQQTNEFNIMHRIKFKSLIRGYHVYKNKWTPYVREELRVQHDERGEALEYDKHSMGIYKNIDTEDSKELIGHAPIEISSLLHHFLNADATNVIKVTITGKRKREVGLVVPAKYACFTRCKRTAKVLDEEIAKMKENFVTLELWHQKKKNYRMFPSFL